jgi:hypothetical protein
VIGEEKLQETINFIVVKGDDPLLALKATSSRLRMLSKEVDCYHKARATGRTQQCE